MVRRVRVARAHLGHVRDPQDEAENANSQGHQLLLLQVGQDFGPKLIFDEGDGHFHVTKLGKPKGGKQGSISPLLLLLLFSAVFCLWI